MSVIQMSILVFYLAFYLSLAVDDSGFSGKYRQFLLQNFDDMQHQMEKEKASMGHWS